MQEYWIIVWMIWLKLIPVSSQSIVFDVVFGN